MSKSMEETGISDSDFKQLLLDFSRWYDGLGYINRLKVLYTDHVPNYIELSEATEVTSLLQNLTGSGNLSRTNLTILYDTIKVTEQFGFKSKIALPLLQRLEEHEVSRFTRFRQFLFKLGMKLTRDDIRMLDVRHNEMPLLKNYKDSWHMILDLEHRKKLCEEKIYSFIEGLPSYLAVKALWEDKAGKSEQPRTSRSDEGNGEPSTLKRSRQKLDKDIIIKDSLIKMQQQLYRDLKTMTPSIWHKNHAVDIAETFTELILHQSTRKGNREPKDKEEKDEKEYTDEEYTDDEEQQIEQEQVKSTCIMKAGKPASLTEVLDLIKSTDACKVIIRGKGGMGKTTLLKYIAYQWATDEEHVFADKLLFMMNIREIKACVKFLDMIVKNMDSNGIIIKNDLNDNSVEDFLVKHDDEIVILLDGYDELERDAKDPLDLFKGTELQKSTVVITSRPDNTADLVKSCDVHIEVKGFSPGNIKKYIHKHFKSIGATKVGELLIKELRLDSEYTMHWGGDHKEAFEMCSSPLLLLHICTTWKQIRRLPTYLPDLFKEIICCNLTQYLNRTGNGTAIANFDRIPDKYMSALLTLGECMYEGLKKNALAIDKYVLSEMANNKNLVDLALDFGFVYEDSPVDPGDRRQMYTPPHKLISEALAGLYLSARIQKESAAFYPANKIEEDHSKAEEYEVIRSNKYLHMTRVFTVGFLGAKAGKLLKHWLIRRASNFYSIAQYFRHVKDEHEHLVLQELDNNSEMKACCEQICQSFRRIPNNKDIKNMHLFKLMCYIECKNRNYGKNEELEKAAISMIDISSEESLRISCRDFVHSAVVAQGVWLTNHFFECISNWGDKSINILSTAMKDIDMTYNQRVINFRFEFQVSSLFLIHFLKHARNLSTITCCITSVLSEVINELHKTHTKLKLTKLTINDLRDTDGGLLEKLFEVAPELKYLKVGSCTLSGSIIKMMKYCCRMNVVLIFNILQRRQNLNLSDIDGESLAALIYVVSQSMKKISHYYKTSDSSCIEHTFSWSKYSLTADNLKRLVESCVNMRLNWKRIDLSKVNLSSVSGRTLACLFKISPDLIHIDMSHCSLSGIIVNEMMEECGRMNVKDNMLRLKGNDLSDIDGKSLAELFRIVNDFFIWSDYSLSGNNIQRLVESGVNMRLNWELIDLSGIDLSSVSGRTLACLFKISPDLSRIDMSHCSLSVSIIIEMMEECGRLNVALKDNMLVLVDNDLSDIDGKSLAALLRVVFKQHGVFRWSDYSLSADNLQRLVESGVNMKPNWKVIDLSKINLSAVSGRTLACLVKISPDLSHIDMSYCSLLVSIVNEMMKECGRMNVKDHMLRLKGNDLSNIDGKSLAKLVMVLFDGQYETFRWSDYSLSADNLKRLVVSGVYRKLNWKWIDFSKINLSSVSGRTLACLFEISPYLIHIDLNHCSLSGNIVNEMMKECGRKKVVLKDNMLVLKGNNLSGINGKSLAELVRVIHLPYDIYSYTNGYFIWRDYFLSAYNLERLVESGVNMRLNWKLIELSGINLSPLCGRTLALLFKISPYLSHIKMRYCWLSVSIVDEMIEECGRMNIVLEENMLDLEGNHFSVLEHFKTKQREIAKTTQN
ncbi:uncharacterized protein LOC117103856 isoform X2 [Anneissia japonica]|uniref:uncharacterized protein LOC117103856 isoform X2 n=1 Tax=Anneissia japonica TaxID=1529436 RepID=UPI0014256DEF|nr:uncharacterized protein LOC117103856 isoform X2 [Anneissia japonica]